MPFAPRTFTFLMENQLMDSREWFKEHRNEYEEYVLDPLAELFIRLTPAMLEIDPGFICIPAAGKSICRIWRDTRFLKDKTIFRSSIWFTFVEQKYCGLPGFHFAISPSGCDWGCGWWRTGSETVESIREHIISGSAGWQEAISAYNSQDSFVLKGEALKKTRFPDRPADERFWLDRKTFCLLSEKREPEFVFRSDVADIVAEDFQKIAPIYRFFKECTVRNSYSGSR